MTSRRRFATVLVSLCITSLTRRVSCCTNQVSLTSSISGRNACPSEEVTFTCTAQTTAVFWGHKGFGEKTMHYTSPRSGGEFRADIVNYDRNLSCLVSSLGFRATASRNGTTVTCTSRNRSSSQSLSLHIMNVALENFTVVQEPNSTVLLGWKVTPTDGHYCIRNYNIQIAGPNGSQWEEQIPGSQHSFHFTGLQLLPFQEYTYCVTANLLHLGQIGLKLTLLNFTEVQEPHPPTNLSAVVQCKQGYEIQIDWQPPLPILFAAPLTGYLLQYNVCDNTSTIELPLNTSYTLVSVPSGALYTITVSALSDVGPSTNSPSIQLAVPSSFCEGSQSSVATQSVSSSSCEGSQSSVATPSSVATQNTPESTESVDDESSPLNSITIIIISSGVGAFTCILLHGICFCIVLRKRTPKQEIEVSQHMTAVSKPEDQGPRYEEVPIKVPHYEEILVQNNCVYHTLEPPA